MTRFDDMKGVFGLLPTPYRDDLEIHIDDLKKVANFCCESGQHGIVWPVMVGEFWFWARRSESGGWTRCWRRSTAACLWSSAVPGSRCRRCCSMRGRRKKPERIRLSP